MSGKNLPNGNLDGDKKKDGAVKDLTPSELEERKKRLRARY
jgi:hypothetical protein